MKRLIRWFNVKPTGESFWDSIAGQKVYTFIYLDNNQRFLATSIFSTFRVEVPDRNL
jgi:predicted RNA-binding protein (virulence factor B family)